MSASSLLKWIMSKCSAVSKAAKSVFNNIVLTVGESSGQNKSNFLVDDSMSNCFHQPHLVNMVLIFIFSVTFWERRRILMLQERTNFVCQHE